MPRYRAEYYQVVFRRRRGPILVAVLMGLATAVLGFSLHWGAISLVLGFVAAGVTYSLSGRGIR